MTPPFWPFKSKKPVEEVLPESKIIEYGISDTNSAENVLDDRSHLEDENYKLAMDKLGFGSPNGGESRDELEEVVEETDLSDESKVDLTGDWVENEDDGYWYRKMPDGSWDPVAYVKSEDGSFEPYS